MPPDPAAIARRLSKAQRKGLMRKPSQHWYSGPIACLPHHMSTAMSLWRQGLIYGYGSTPFHSVFAVTPIGLLVRAELERMEAKDE